MTDTAVAVRRSITVNASPERAFDVFTAGFSSWWPLETHHIGKADAAEAVIEPRAGGRWFERAADGTECDWGRVLAWEPPARVVLEWQISADWQPDPEIHTEVEVRFTAEGERRTRVDLEHRGLESFGGRAEQMRAVFGSDDGWNGLLGRFAAKASAR
jgi:uncharacterized protein YndB with AHSA1/START domain